MTIWNLGSVNADLVYRLPHLPTAGETLAATSHSKGLGGKGANMSVAAVRADAQVEHIGALGADGDWMRERLLSYGVGVSRLTTIGPTSGHAIIMLDEAGENQIVIYPAANRLIEAESIPKALSAAQPGDIALCQNETNAQVEFLSHAGSAGLRVAYAAAPFDVDSVRAALPFLDILILNAVEAQQLEQAIEEALNTLPVADIVVTLGGEGCRWINRAAVTDLTFPAPRVEVVDTTGAGDTFTGYFLAALDAGETTERALDLAQRAGAVMVTRLGTADVIPTRKEVADFFDPA